jgi:2-polyprenyl-3-methyl-5-hydroxy-6-metoxy-1,4-benzoquinol methylase
MPRRRHGEDAHATKKTRAGCACHENVFGHRKKLEFLRLKISEYVGQHQGRALRLLDVGCSNGQYVTIHLGDLGVSILAIDPHEPSILHAREHNPYPERIEFRVATVDQLPGDEKFDIVVMSDVLEHLEDPGALLDSARERLTEDGVILVSIPNGWGPFEIENALDKRGCLAPSYLLFRAFSALKGFLTGRRRVSGSGGGEEPYAHECGHVQFWTLGAFRRLLTDHGFEMREMRNGPWMGALCTSTWWGRSRRFCEWNARMGSLLPSWAVSTWYFAARLR